MNGPLADVAKRFSSSKILVSIVISITLIVASTAAAIALSGSTAKTVLKIQSVSADPAEAYANQLVEWTVMVEVQDQGQQGKGLLFTWDWGDGNYSVYELKSLGANSTAIDVETHAWSQSGLYEVVISVWDGYGSELNAFHNVSQVTQYAVKPVANNTPPIAAFVVEPDEGTVNTIFVFNATASSDLEDPPEAIEVRWNWESDSVWDTLYSPVKIAEHQFSEAGTYTVTLEVMDQGGMVDQTTREVTVVASPVLLAHDPIVITGDDDFIHENGVVSGIGTYQNPYIIGGWHIQPTEGNGITVQGTTKYFTICDTQITGSIDTCMYGVYLEVVDHATLSDLNVSGFWMGIHTKLTNELTVNACQVTWNSWGLFALRCGSIFVTENEMSHNVVGTGNHEGIMVQETDYAYIAMNDLVDNWDGVFMYFVSNGIILNNTMTDNGVGIQALYSSCTIFGNSISSKVIGIILCDCPDTDIQSNSITTIPSTSIYDSYSGIEFMSCTNLNVLHNTIDSYHDGITTDASYSYYPYSENVTIAWNRVSNCGGSAMSACFVSNLTVTANVFLSSGTGIDVDSSAVGVQVYHNDFVDNSIQAFEDPLCVGNDWDEGYPSGGNYWSDYQGTDEYSGVDQIEPGSDGIGDTPYVLASGSQDNYPLMGQLVPVAHAPIVITSDDEFTIENGVIGGTGLQDDPYVISGWEITSTDRSCINISNTRAYFEIRDVDLRTDSFEVYAMYLGDAYNGSVINSHTSGGMVGLMMESCSFILVADCDFTENIYGVQVSSSQDFELRNCDFTDCAHQAFTAYWSYTFSVASCTLKADYAPCWLDRCGQGVFTGNYLEPLSDSRTGAYVMESTNMIFNDNHFMNSSIDITGQKLSDFNTHNISADNTVNGRPILHYQGLSDLVLDGTDAGEVIIVECQNVTLSNMTFSCGFAGVIVAYSDRAVIENNVFTSCWIGTRVWDCSEVVLRGNVYDKVVQQAIGIWDTVGATVENNVLSSNGIFRYQTLMPIYRSSDMRLTNNTLTDSWEGVYMFYTSDVDISGNLISGMISLGLYVGYSSNLDITENEFARNGIGVSLNRCNGVSVYHNNFLGNTVQASDTDGVNNQWDDGYPSGGNYWDDYRGVDKNDDGIGDTPYEIVGGSQDDYPLMTTYYVG